MDTTAYIKASIRDMPLFLGLEEQPFNDFAESLHWFTLPGGATLLEEGDVAQSLYIVMHGTLGVFVERDGKKVFVDSVSRGETVGEMGIISGGNRAATLIALRDCELLELDLQSFERFAITYPRRMLKLVRRMVRKFHKSVGKPPSKINLKSVAIVPLNSPKLFSEFFEQLRHKLYKYGKTAAFLGSDSVNNQLEWFFRQETRNDYVFYITDFQDPTWVKRCLRQADLVLFVGSHTSFENNPVLDGLIKTLSANQPREFVFLHEKEPKPPSEIASAQWQSWGVRMVHHIREGRGDDHARLVRFIMGKAVGLVLSGGGARALAHLGVIQALHEAGIPIDLVGGSSMGAIIGAAVAMGWDFDTIFQKMRESFFDTNPVNDYTFPLLALVRGKKVSWLLKRQFGSTRIENLQLPFYCVSTDLIKGQPIVHRIGTLWQALRASSSIPGLLPPVFEEGQVRVDGGLTNNFPLDIMLEKRRGPVIGSDILETNDKVPDSFDSENLSWLSLYRKVGKAVPNIVEVLTRASTTGSRLQSQNSRHKSDLVIEIKIPNIRLTDFSWFDHIVAMGYLQAKEIINNKKEKFLLDA